VAAPDRLSRQAVDGPGRLGEHRAGDRGAFRRLRLAALDHQLRRLCLRRPAGGRPRREAGLAQTGRVGSRPASAVVGIATLLYLVPSDCGSAEVRRSSPRVGWPWRCSSRSSPVFFACVIGLAVCCEGHPALAPLRARWGLATSGRSASGSISTHDRPRDRGGRPSRGSSSGRSCSDSWSPPALCLAISAASWAWIDKPCLRLKGPVQVRREPREDADQAGSSAHGLAPVPSRELGPGTVS